MWSPKIPPPFFSNKKCMVWTFLCSKIALLPLPSNRTCTSEVLFFHKLQKAVCHDCTDHIKTLFSSDNYHETRNINTSQAAMLLVPGHNCATLLVPVHTVHNVTTRIDRSCCGGMITGRFVSLLIKKYQRDKSKTLVGK